MAAIARLAFAARAAGAAMAPMAPARAMATGTVKWFNIKKGFGFISPDDAAQPEIFAHHTAIQASGFRYLSEGDKVKFDVQKADRGNQAVNITQADGTPFNRPPPPSTGGYRPEGGFREGGFRPEGGFRGPRREGGFRQDGGGFRPRRERSPSETGESA